MTTDVDSPYPLQPTPAPPAPERFEFSGQGGEYFRIWIVNLALSILTLGIYSAWAKVRRLQYFYRHTRLAGASFDYHGQPLAILKGRLLALGLFLIYSFTGEVAPLLAIPAFFLLGLLLPWLLRSSLRFRLHNSSWRGLRFSFRGGLKDAYILFLLLGTLGVVTGFLWPLFHSRLKRYQHGNSWFGATQGVFDARDSQFFGLYLRASLFALVVFVATLVLLFLLRDALLQHIDPTRMRPETVAVLGMAATFLLLILAWFLITPYFTAALQNLVWNHTRLGPHAFVSALPTGRLAWVMISNLLLVTLTLGLFMPWASVRLTRLRLQHLSLLPAGDLDSFVAAAAAAAVAAFGEESTEVFDIDIAL